MLRMIQRSWKSWKAWSVTFVTTSIVVRRIHLKCKVIWRRKKIWIGKWSKIVWKLTTRLILYEEEVEERAQSCSLLLHWSFYHPVHIRWKESRWGSFRSKDWYKRIVYIIFRRYLYLYIFLFFPIIFKNEFRYRCINTTCGVVRCSHLGYK